ncbi:MAG: suppressor of fused domain protein, partial [Enterocloster aldenensis]
EFKNIQGKTANIELLLERMKQDNPDLVTDMTRTSSYL